MQRSKKLLLSTTTQCPPVLLLKKIQLLQTLFQVADYVSIMAIKVLPEVKVKGPFRHHLDLSQELHEMKKRLSGLFLVPKHNKKEGHCVRLLR